MPYALREEVEKELDKLEHKNVIVKIDRSDWGAPIVVVPKADRSVRICGDYKVTVNQAVEDEQYPLPTVQDLFATLAGGTVFSKLDMSHAYAQLSVDKESQKYLCINTHKGLYAYTKLPYGIKSAPKIFQSMMDKILHGLPKVVCFQDDILVTGENKEEHMQVLAEVLERLEKHNVKLQRKKCDFLSGSVVYLGYRIDAQGLHPLAEKVEAIVNAPEPKNVSELKSFLGMIQYYARFLPDVSTKLAPFHELLKKNVEWKWSDVERNAFRVCKKSLSSDSLLVHYDAKKPLKLACDVSSYGVGAVISHVLKNGQERPIAFASRTLNKSEQNYAQIEKEALSIIFGVKKFHQYLYGRKFVLETDHKLLVAILGPKSGIPTLAAARMQRWAVILAAYDYDIVYRRSEDHSNADVLSRLPHEESDIGQEGKVYHIDFVNDDFPIRSDDIAKITGCDPTLKLALEFTANGWPEHSPSEDLKPYHLRRSELSIEDGCLLWGMRVIIPHSLRSRILDELHSEHPGMCNMKRLARSFVWWPKLDEDIECTVKRCSACQDCRSSPPSAPLHTWSWPTRPFQRIHIDFFEKEKMPFLILVDSHSKWIEVKQMTSTTVDRTLDELHLIFANHGLPEEVVSDNGPQFITSGEFATFMRRNGIKHTLTPPYHPASNGAAERSVRIVKEALTKQVLGGSQKLSVKHRLANLLMKYRSMPQTTTGCTPSELMLRRKMRTRLSLIKPNLAEYVEKKQMKQKEQHDGKQSVRLFKVGDSVRVKNTAKGVKQVKERWVRGKVVKICGTRSYSVRIGQSVRYVHVDHLISAEDGTSRINDQEEIEVPEVESTLPSESHANVTSSVGDHIVNEAGNDVDQDIAIRTPLSTVSTAPCNTTVTNVQKVVTPRRSGRVRRPLDRLDL